MAQATSLTLLIWVECQWQMQILAYSSGTTMPIQFAHIVSVVYYLALFWSVNDLDDPNISITLHFSQM
jgi:hypothetical protein